VHRGIRSQCNGARGPQTSYPSQALSKRSKLFEDDPFEKFPQSGILSEIQDAEIRMFNKLPTLEQTFPQRINAIRQKAQERERELRRTTTPLQQPKLLDQSIQNQKLSLLLSALEEATFAKKSILTAISEAENKWGIIGMENLSIFDRVQLIEQTTMQYKAKLKCCL
jgi:hypothetical protein